MFWIWSKLKVIYGSMPHQARFNPLHYVKKSSQSLFAVWYKSETANKLAYISYDQFIYHSEFVTGLPALTSLSSSFSVAVNGNVFLDF